MKQLLSLVFILVSMSASASNYFVEGTRWLITYGISSTPDTYALTEIYIEGDSIVSDVPCMKMWWQYGTEEPKLMTLVRTEGEKVFFIDPNDDSNWVLAYDFGLQPGERCTVGSVLKAVLWPEDPVDMSELEFLENITHPTLGYDGQMMHMKEIYPASEVDNITYYWIDGIGSFGGPMKNCLFDYDGIYSWLHKVESNGKVIYENTLTGIENVMRDDASGKCYTIDGKPVESPQKGIFIRDGKKYLKR